MIGTEERAMSSASDFVRDLLTDEVRSDDLRLAGSIAGATLAVERHTAIECADLCDTYGHHAAADVIRRKYGIAK